MVTQTRIETSIDLTKLPAAANGGGLLGGLIINSMDDRAKTLTAALQAKTDVAPLRAALAGFDVDALALATTRAALTPPNWFKPGEAVLRKDGTAQARTAFLRSVASPQVAIVTYGYSLSPDFTQIRMIAEVLLIARGRPGPTELSPLYSQRLASIVQLSKQSYERRKNATA
jgi:hypothetical protein